MKLVLKNDKYRQSRGGTSKFIDVSCAKCSQLLVVYQKDGPGILKRMYLDRISFPENISPKLVCSGCGEVIGTPTIYEKEGREAIHLRQGFFSKKIHKD